MKLSSNKVPYLVHIVKKKKKNLRGIYETVIISAATMIHLLNTHTSDAL